MSLAWLKCRPGFGKLEREDELKRGMLSFVESVLSCQAVQFVEISSCPVSSSRFPHVLSDSSRPVLTLWPGLSCQERKIEDIQT